MYEKQRPNVGSSTVATGHSALDHVWCGFSWLTRSVSGAGSIRGNVKRKFFPLAARVSLFAALSPFGQGRGRWQRRAWAVEDVQLGHMGTASNPLRRYETPTSRNCGR